MLQISIEAEEWADAPTRVRERILQLTREQGIDIVGLADFDEMIQNEERYDKFYGDEEAE